MVTKKEEQKKEPTEKAMAIAGKDISTAGFAVAIASIFTNFFTLGLTAVVGLVLSIIGRVQSSKAGHPNPLALAGIIISGVVMALTFILVMFFVMLFVFSASRGDYRDIQCETDMSVFSAECHDPDTGSDSPMYRYPHSKS